MREKWWERSVVYQIYPISFADSDGDGCGDLKGIIDKLDYLEELGIGAVWLNPVYDSPDVDMGYDIRDYRKIHSRYGNMDDMKALIKGLHERGIRLIMDLVLNHTSNQHEWFKKASASRDSEYHDYYIWQEGTPDELPSDMGSFFTPSCWKYNEATGEWYLHLFAEEQPDLNWENPRLRKDVYDTIRFWEDMGVDGFRMDVINLIAKELKLEKATRPSGMLYPEQFASRPKLHEYLKELRRECARPSCDFFLGETPFTDDDDVAALIKGGDELDMLFQFDFMNIGEGLGKWDVKPLDLAKMKKSLFHWQDALGISNSVFWSNHDQVRPISCHIDPKTGRDWLLSGKMLAVAMHFLQGTSFVYQGEEIGMLNYPSLSERDLFDVESIEWYRTLTDESEKKKALEAISKRGRENARSPMQWNASKNAGFTTGTPWAPLNPSYDEINVEKEREDRASILNFYKKVIAMKSGDPVLINGAFKPLLPEDPAIFAYERILGDTSYRIVCNFTDNAMTVDEGLLEGEILLSNYSDASYELRPYEARVLKKKGN